MILDSKRENRVAILGAGMLGSALAILLARKGVRVTLFDASPRPMSRAGRWNEGKIHLGYLYAADRSVDTARKLMPGGVAFQSIVEDLIDGSIESHLTSADELLLSHAKSVVDPDSMFRYLKAVWALDSKIRTSHTPPTSLTKAELEQVTEHPDIVAGFRVPERSVDPNWLADRIAERVAADRLIECRCDCLVTSLAKERGRWRVATDSGAFDGFDAVVNALWEGKSAIDETVGRPPQSLSYRYRVAVFMKVRNVAVGSATITIGPFGDMKNYDGRHLYLSWYPVGLLVDRHQERAPPTPKLDSAGEAEIYQRMIEALSRFFPGVRDLPAAAESVTVRGGWIVANGKGLLSDPNSTLHRRNTSIMRDDNYVSVETGKYSVAPWLAAQIARDLTG